MTLAIILALIAGVALIGRDVCITLKKTRIRNENWLMWTKKR